MTRHSNLLTPISLKELQNNSWNFQPKYSLDMLDTLPISHQAMIKYEHHRIIKHFVDQAAAVGRADGGYCDDIVGSLGIWNMSNTQQEPLKWIANKMSFIKYIEFHIKYNIYNLFSNAITVLDVHAG